MDPYILIDVAVFIGFVVAVVATGLLKSRHEKDSEGYFLAGRGLMWYLIGFSLIAANISTEQFVGQSSQGAAHVGLAIASYEWLASITLVFVAFFFLPAFLRVGLYTIPEFLEYRYSRAARSIMSLLMMVTLVCVNLPAVIYSGAKTGEVVFGAKTLLGMPIDLVTVSWILGILGGVYVTAGGLKACAWADLLQGSALIVGGAAILVLTLGKLADAPPEKLTVGTATAAAQEPAAPTPDLARAGAWERFKALNSSKLHMVLPASDPFVPWTALVIGLWIPNLYYWGLNQYIMQRTLGSKSLAEGQKGVVLAAGLKLLIPFIVIFPGMMAFNLYKQEMKDDASTKTNQETLDSFDAQKASPEASRMVFSFDDEFAKLYPDKGLEIVAFNARVLGAAAAPGKPLGEANKELLRGLAAKNKLLPKDQRVEVQKDLIGYKYDSAFGLLLLKVVPTGLFGFVLAAILGAVISTLAAMLNAASTIFTMDIYKQYLHRSASQANLVAVGRASVVACMVLGCLMAPQVDHPRFKGIFTFIQEFQGFISPGILAVFVYGVFAKRAPRACGVVGLVLSPVFYGLLMLALPDVAFLNRMAISFAGVVVVLGMMRLMMPLPAPIVMPTQGNIDLTTSRGAVWAGVLVVAVTVALYVVFW